MTLLNEVPGNFLVGAKILIPYIAFSDFTLTGHGVFGSPHCNLTSVEVPMTHWSFAIAGMDGATHFFLGCMTGIEQY